MTLRLFALAVLVPATAFARVPNPYFVGLPDNDWITCDVGGMTGDPGLFAYSRGSVDQESGTIIMFGGGHGDSPENSVWLLHINDIDGVANPWELRDGPDPWDDSSGFDLDFPGAVFNPVGEDQHHAKPVSQHTGATSVFVTSLGEHIFLGYSVGNVWKSNEPSWGGWLGSPTSGHRGYVLASGTWNHRSLTGGIETGGTLQPGYRDGLGDEHFAAYDPVLDVVWHVGSQTRSYDPHADSWQARGSSGSARYSFCGEYVDSPSVGRAIFVIGLTEWEGSLTGLWQYSIAAGTWTEAVPVGPDGMNAGLAYDSLNDTLLLKEHGTGVVWALELFNMPAGWQLVASGLPVFDAYDAGSNRFSMDRWHYDPVNNVIFEYGHHPTIIGGVNGVIAYRYQGGHPPTDEVAPGPPTNLSAR